MRLIDADQAGKYLYEHLDDLHMIAAQNAIDEMPTVDVQPVMSDWIKCSERMPDKDGDYLCISNHERKILPYMNGEFYCVCFDAVLRCCNSSVTRWMPLPDMPKEDESNVGTHNI